MTALDRFQTYNYDPLNPNKSIPLTPIDRVSKEVARQLYREMVRLRRMEEALIREYHPADEIRCPSHFCVGQEVAPATLSLLLGPQDYLFSHHRSHGFYLSKVHGMKGLFAELYGKETGSNGGKAGSQDISEHSSRFYSGAILAGAVPIAAGAAWGIRNRNEKNCAITATGEAATDEGVYWETLNYAALKKLPMVFICENNFYSTYSPQNKRSSSLNISERVQAFGMPVKAFFGNDVVLAYQEIREAIDSCQAGKGPTFIEMFTYRWNGHVGPESDDYNHYRPQAELEYWKSLCPIRLMELQAKGTDVLSEDFRARVVQEVDQEICEAFEFAKNSPFPNNLNFESFNWSHETPLADRYLRDEHQIKFAGNQSEVLPGPY